MKQLLILSGKGGTGKTTIAGAFIKLSNVKAYADCDVDAPNLHLISNRNDEVKLGDYYSLPKANLDNEKCVKCGLCLDVCRFDAITENNGTLSIDDYACEGCGICSHICPAGAITMSSYKAGDMMLYENLPVFSTAQLKMGSGTSGMLVTQVKKQLKDAADNKAELAIIDGSPGIGCPVIASLTGADMVLIVTEPSISGFSDMERIIKTARIFGTQIAVCVNKYDTNIKKTNRIKKYCEDDEIPFVGTIPYDKDAVKAINSKKTIVDINCISGSAVRNVYKNTINILNSAN